ncbi:MAG: hypothetical protein IT181_13085 [Acidobacteria bacterium]|nr:hypothetical protein [Acidobacteriota bacterium]
MLEVMNTPTRPPHNLFGDRGPRCPACSGLGRRFVLGNPSGTRLQQTSQCACKGTGIDLERVRDQREAALLAEIATLRADVALSMKAGQSFARQLKKLERRFATWTPPKGMNSRQMWAECIAWATADGTAVANSTTETIIFPNVTLPGGYMQDGRLLEMEAFGKLSTTGTPTMVWALRWGGVAGTLLATTEAITMGSGVANVNWNLRAKIQTRTNGSAGSLIVSGTVLVHTAAGTVAANVFGVSGYDNPAEVSALDLTADTALSLTADWSAASASNTLTGHQYDLVSWN